MYQGFINIDYTPPPSPREKGFKKSFLLLFLETSVISQIQHKKP